MRRLLVLFLWIVYLPCHAQDVLTMNGVDCGIHGSSRVGTMDYRLNEYKSRYRFPRKTDFDTAVHLVNLAESGDPNQFSFDKAVVIRGYVFNVKEGGVETCNCKSKDVAFRDTHIEITVGESATGPQYRVIAEVTPRFRQIMQQQGVDWSTRTLKQTLKGHHIEIAGWLFYDAEHETEAYANDPDDMIGRKNWRATCWEVHPITYLKISDGDETSTEEIISQHDKDKDHNNDRKNPQEGGHNNAAWIAAVFLIVIVILVYLLLKK